MKLTTLTKMVVLISLMALPLHSIAQSGSLNIQHQAEYDPETEPDYGPGFWESEYDTTAEDEAGGEKHEEHLETQGPAGASSELYIESSEDFDLHDILEPLIRFPQTRWNECSDRITGNYGSFGCSSRRNIAVILKSFMNSALLKCVNAGLEAQGGGYARSLHIQHAGITADSRHSSKSLHSVNRAIDVKKIRVQKTNGRTQEFTYAKTGNRPFYTALRRCWGRTIADENSCPLYKRSTLLTASIGWENRNHGRHMHLSVPYCISGRHGPGLWKR